VSPLDEVLWFELRNSGARARPVKEPPLSFGACTHKTSSPFLNSRHQSGAPAVKTAPVCDIAENEQAVNELLHAPFLTLIREFDV